MKKSFLNAILWCSVVINVQARNSYSYSDEYNDTASGSSIFSALSGVARVSVAFTALKYAYENTDNMLLKKGVLPAIGLVWFIGEINKENPKYYNHVATLAKSPWVITRKSGERLFCGGESLIWNDIVIWRKRINQILSPFTKQATVVDLSRDKRLSVLNQFGDNEELKDIQSVHILENMIKQLQFLSGQLEMNKKYYKQEPIKRKRHVITRVITIPLQYVMAAGAACMRLGVNRHDEIAFYIEQLQAHISSLIEYIKTVATLSDLDKEKMKTYLGLLTDILEHMATLVDVETAAASRTPEGKLLLNSIDGKTPRRYSNYGGYGEDY